MTKRQQTPLRRDAIHADSKITAPHKDILQSTDNVMSSFKHQAGFSIRNSLRWTILVFGLVVSAWLIWTAKSAHTAADGVQRPTSVTGTFASASANQSGLQKATTKTIESLRVGDRVLAKNPQVSNEERASWSEPDWNDWVRLTLEMPLPYDDNDGEPAILDIELLRPESWLIDRVKLIAELPNSPPPGIAWPSEPVIEPAGYVAEVPRSPLREVFRRLETASADLEAKHGSLVGLAVHLQLPEMGAVGPAMVTGLDTNPEIRDGAGRVITATFSHPPSADVLNAGFEGESVPIEVTGNHPFWSADRQGFVPIDEMKIGERVVTFHGETKRLVSLHPRPGPELVFNLEVHGEHVYHVGEQGILAHNSYDVEAKIAARTATRAEWKAYNRAQRVARTRASGMGRGGNQLVDRAAGEIAGANAQAGRVLATGSTGNTAWGRLYQLRVQGKLKGKFGKLPVELFEGNARQQIADKLLANNPYMKRVIPNRGHVLGTRNAKGNLLRPDWQVPIGGGKFAILDLTTSKSAAKIWKYQPGGTNKGKVPILFNILWD